MVPAIRIIASATSPWRPGRYPPLSVAALDLMMIAASVARRVDLRRPGVGPFRFVDAHADRFSNRDSIAVFAFVMLWQLAQAGAAAPEAIPNAA